MPSSSLFAPFQVWLAVVGSSVVLGYGVTVVVEFIQEQREKRRLSRFFSPSVLKEIVRHRSDRALGSSRRLLALLFSDLRGFTSISEQLLPEQVVELLREYLSELTEVTVKGNSIPVKIYAVDPATGASKVDSERLTPRSA